MYHITFTSPHRDILVSALDLYINLQLGNWGVVVDYSPIKQFAVPEGRLPGGDYPIMDVPPEKTQRYRTYVEALGYEFLKYPNVLHIENPAVPDRVRRANALRMEITGYTTEIEVSQKDAYILIDALDIYMRLRIGQWGMVLDHAPDMEAVTHEDKSVTFQKVQDYTKFHCYRDIMNRWGAEYINYVPNGSFGIHSDAVEDVARVAYDMKQVIRHRIAWDQNPEGSFGVDFDKPWMTTKAKVPLITITRIEE